MKKCSIGCLYRNCKFYNENAFGGYCSNPEKCKFSYEKINRNLKVRE